MASVFDLKDTSTLKDDGTFGLTGKPIEGVRVVLEHCARAIRCKRGSMRWARAEGEDIGELENGDFSRTELEQRRAAYDRAIQRVDFVLGVQSTLTIGPDLKARYAAQILIEGVGVVPLAVTVDKAGPIITELRL